MYAAGSAKDWKDSLDAAVEKFRAAGCPEPDIQAALRNHTEAEKLDLPPVKASTSIGNRGSLFRPHLAADFNKELPEQTPGIHIHEGILDYT